ncbi:kinase/pyrophosphorylase, partial [Staphylococcus saprophyticus]|uniref:kinase/pyrophosphorylase n=1 Tax=Staphylococcus saprophyticus TaxID=29385 RepID=UPI00370374D3
MYLADNPYNIPNIPFLPHLHIPHHLFKHNHFKLFPLTPTPHYILNIPNHPLKILPLSPPSNYNTIHTITQQLIHPQ